MVRLVLQGMAERHHVFGEHGVRKQQLSMHQQARDDQQQHALHRKACVEAKLCEDAAASATANIFNGAHLSVLTEQFRLYRLSKYLFSVI
jgi:hypothetical protein